MNKYIRHFILILIRRERRALEGRISKMFDIKLSIDLDKCVAVEQILGGK